MSSIHQTNRAGLNIAVIGTGIAGMSAAWLLNKKHRVTVYEKNKRVGGHSHTVVVPTKNAEIPVDIGFIVYNDINYPNLRALFENLSVPTQTSDMSFSASLYDQKLEYAGTNLNTLFGQRTNIVRPQFWMMLRDVMRFFRETRMLLAASKNYSITIEQHLKDHNYSNVFIEHYLLPMGAAIWSTTTSDIKRYPAEAFLRFFCSHGLLDFKGRPQWKTVQGGSAEYVKRLTQTYAHRIHFEGIRAITRYPDKVILQNDQGQTHSYDHVVIATHADEAIKLLFDPDPMEKRLLGAWTYTHNRAVLHRDVALMPKHRRVWSSWNFMGTTREKNQQQLCLTYWINRLQSLKEPDPIFLTLNPAREPDSSAQIGEFAFTHPFFDHNVISSQKELWSLQGYRRTWFCGSYFGYGFHEDALEAGLAVAEQLGGLQRPWVTNRQSDRISITNNRQSAAA